MNESKADRFWELLKPEYKQAVLFCRKLAGDSQNGDDLAQDALVKALNKFDTLRDQSAFKPWLYRIMINTYTSQTRLAWWRKRVTWSDEIIERTRFDDPTDRYTARRWLNLAMEGISPAQKTLIALHELQQWTLAEIARLYGCNEGTIKARLFRARRSMKRIISRHLEQDKPQNKKTTTSTREGIDAV